MKNLIFSFILFGVMIFLFTKCSSSKESGMIKIPDSTYVFDKIPPDTSIRINELIAAIPVFHVKYYIVQIGAFTTKERAEKFAEQSKIILSEKIDILYNNDIKLYVVQLTPFYTQRKEAEKIRNKLWKLDNYRDAWIVTVRK